MVKYNLLCLIGTSGIVACSSNMVNTNRVLVCEFFVDFLLPVIPINSIIVMDNHSAHHGQSGIILAQILALKNCSLVYLPPYSADLNPIENTFGTLNTI